MKYTYKYAKCSAVPDKTSGKGKRKTPDKWNTGPDPVRHDKYYAYLKHRAQARYRGELYGLTWEEWEQFWPNHKWHQRGRDGDSLCLRMLDPLEGWHVWNCEVVTRKEHFIKRRAS